MTWEEKLEIFESFVEMHETATFHSEEDKALCEAQLMAAINLCKAHRELKEAELNAKAFGLKVD